MRGRSGTLLTPETLYQSNGYINAEGLFNDPSVFVWLTGGRGTGKTFNILWELVKRGEPFVLLRRTDDQIKQISKDEMNPFKALNREMGLGIVPGRVSTKVAGFYHSKEVDGVVKPFGPPIGYAVSLSSMAKLRGVDLSEVKTLFFDEFIREPSERGIKNEAEAFLNTYETINRNRELEGEKPLKFIGASNSNQLDNPIFIYLELVTLVEKMRKEGKTIRRVPEKRLIMIDAGNSRISEAKRNTALYKLTKGTAFSGMALENSYNVDSSLYKSKNLREYKPLCSLGEVTIYEHKSNGTFYCSPHRIGNPPQYKYTEQSRKQFKLSFRRLPMYYYHGLITFETYFTESIFLAFLS